MANNRKNAVACKLKSSAGFSLGELLAVVAIVIILLALIIPNVVSYARELRQKELDQKAETIYTSVQNQLIKLYSSGDFSSFEGSKAEGQLAEYVPGDSEHIEKGQLFFVTSASRGMDGTAAGSMVTEDTLDTALWGNDWIVEYDPASASVYAVFYSEKAGRNIAQEYVSDLASGNEFNALRMREGRIQDGVEVGYYGGDSTTDVSTNRLTATITPTNAEILAANVECIRPGTVGKVSYEVFLADAEGNSFKRTFTTLDIEMQASMGRKFVLDLTFDDLASKDTRFASTYGSSRWLAANHWEQQEGTHALTCGSEFAFTVVAKLDGGITTIKDSDPATWTTNSLFAYDKDEDGDTALIGYGRHLQNLDETSGVTSAITKAKQTSDVLFGEDSEWFEIYGGEGGTYFNGNDSFKPLVNDGLESFDGNGFAIENLTSVGTLNQDGSTSGAAALFDSVSSDLALTDVKLYRPLMAGSSLAAGLVGSVSSGMLTINGSCVYLAKSSSEPSDDGFVQTQTWLTAPKVGGLVGDVSQGAVVAINESFAAAVLGAVGIDTAAGSKSVTCKVAGGLIGSVAGSASISASFADNYIFGQEVGGLVGFTSTGSRVSLSSAYAAGFAASTSDKGHASGLVNGTVTSATSCYSVCYYLGSNGYSVGEPDGAGNTTEGISYTIYNVAQKGGSALSRVYYIDYDGDESKEPSGCTAMGNDTTAAKLAQWLDSSFFSNGGGGATPYNLMGQTLDSAYPYTTLLKTSHHGDWSAVFQPGSLVYYEHYSDGNYGFFGANVTSTLRDSAKSIVNGDGYAIVYKEGGSEVPNSIHVSVRNKAGKVYYDGDVNLTAANRKAVTSEGGSTYYLYPLPASANNFGYGSYKDGGDEYKKAKDYYLGVIISASSAEPTYWNFNPHFAKTVERVQTASSWMNTVGKIRIRTARHLNNLSRYYVNYENATKKRTFSQERDIDYGSYKWTTYTNSSSKVTSQEPIGIYVSGDEEVGTVSFKATYDGGGHAITGLSIVSTSGESVGLFAINEGTVKNTSLVSDYGKGAGDNLTVTRRRVVQKGSQLSIGILVGSNETSGVIQNCAVAGYYLSGSKGMLRSYSGSTIYAGGLVGSNMGTVKRCSAETPLMTVTTTSSTVYAGGFVGHNQGSVENSYAIGAINTSTPNSGTIVIAGFAADNQGLLRNSYCATSLTSAGVALGYGFAKEGTVTNCYFLNGGVNEFIGNLKLYNSGGKGMGVSYAKLKSLQSGVATKARSQYHANTNEDAYPFNAVVTNSDGKLVHYGDWPVTPNLGTVGLVYWEHEEGGSNEGYNFYAAGYDEGVKTVKSSLCKEHDDGGKITEYGYGYYVKGTKADDLDKVTSSTTNLHVAGYDAQASSELAEALPGFVFKVYKTAGINDSEATGLYLSSTDYRVRAAGWTLTYQGQSYGFDVNPFFGASVQFTSASNGLFGSSSSVADNALGESGNQYQIRSADQLQYINWNCNLHSATASLDKTCFNNMTNGQVSTAYRTSAKAVSYPFLGYAYAQDASTVQHHSALYYWNQSHDVNANMPTDGSRLFTPIGSTYDSGWGSSTNTSYVYSAYFNGSYVGNSYQVKNVQISSKSQSVGLFGTVIAARIEGLVLFSDRGNVIKTHEEGTGWYNLGSIAGMAFKGSGSITGKMANAGFYNCTSAGYKVTDNRGTGTDPNVGCGYGGANFGGFVGLTNLNMSGCCATNDMVMAVNYSTNVANTSRYVRTGGLVGTYRGDSLVNCYTGGTITRKTIGSTGFDNNVRGPEITNMGTKFLAAGIVGGWFVRTAGNLKTLFGDLTTVPSVSNCYTYADLSDCPAAYALTPMVSTGNSEGGGSFSVSNCYYFAPKDVTYVKRASSGDGTDAASKVTPITFSQLSCNELQDEGVVPATADMTAAEKSTYLIGGQTLIDKLGSAFHTVTIKETVGEKQVRVDGKYSFPKSSSLDGRNYPFPTLITQTSDGVTANVHYGDWVIAGFQWGSASETLDILDALDANDATVSDQGSAKGEYVLNWIDKSSAVAITLDDIRVTHLDNDEDASDDFVMSLSDSWVNNARILTVKPRKTGSYVVTIEKGASKDSFNLMVTAKVEVTVDPALVTLRENEEADVELKAQSVSGATDITKDAHCIWKATPSDDSLSATWLSVNSPGGTSLSNLTGTAKDTVTNYAAQGTSTVGYHVTYFYAVKQADGSVKEFEFTGSALLTVESPKVVGIFNGTDCYEAVIDSDEPAGGKDYADGKKPAKGDEDLVLYYTGSDDFMGALTVNSVSVTNSQGTYTIHENGQDGPSDQYRVVFATTAVVDSRGFQTLAVGISRSQDVADEPVTVTFDVAVGSKSYCLVASLQSVSENVIGR